LNPIRVSLLIDMIVGIIQFIQVVFRVMRFIQLNFP
jgi:hypothetical protein